MNQSAVAVSSEQTIDRDREFDQTAITCNHGRPKDICGECYPQEDAAADFARRMPDVITRQRLATPFNRQPSIELVTALAERDDLQIKLYAAERRIREFEQFAQNLAETIDEMNASAIMLTGKSFDEHLADLNRERARQRPNPGLCLLPDLTVGSGLRCLRDKGHDGQCDMNPQPPPVDQLDVTKPCPIRDCQLVNGHHGEHVN